MLRLRDGTQFRAARGLYPKGVARFEEISGDFISGGRASWTCCLVFDKMVVRRKTVLRANYAEAVFPWWRSRANRSRQNERVPLIYDGCAHGSNQHER